MIPKQLSGYTAKMIDDRINAEVSRRMKPSIEAVTKYVTTQLFDTLRSNGVGKDRANKIVQDMVKSMID